MSGVGVFDGQGDPSSGLTVAKINRISQAVAQSWKLVALVCFSAWILWVGFAHEPWGDEAQAWLLARDSGLVELLVERVRYEGTPGLWHLILWVLIRLNFTYENLFLVPAAFAVLGAAVVLWWAPFPSWMRISTLTSYFFGYQFSCVARSYSVDLLVIPLAAAWFSSRRERPLRYAVVIALLANLNAFSFLAAAILGLELLIVLAAKLRSGDRLALLAIAMACLGGLFAAATAWPVADNTFLDDRQHVLIIPVLRMMEAGFIDRVTDFYRIDGLPSGAALSWGAIVSLYILVGSILAILRRECRVNVVLSLCILTALCLFGALIYSMPWHAGLLYLFWLFSLWISFEKIGPNRRRIIMFLFGVVAIVQTFETYDSAMLDKNEKYAAGREGAQMIEVYKTSHPGAKIDMAGYMTISVMPFLPGNPFANFNNGRDKPAYMSWNADASYLPYPEVSWAGALSGDADAIVVGSSIYKNHAISMGKLEVFKDVACKAGFHISKHISANSIWRGWTDEDTGLLLLEKGPCNSVGKT